MDYKGVIQSIPFGDTGIATDMAQVVESPTALLEAENVSVRYNQIESDYGSQIWNVGANLPASTVALYDWWPDDHTQRVIAVCSNGRVYKYTSPYSFSEVTPSTALDSHGNAAPVSLNPSPITVIVQGGIEQVGNPRKLFILTGNDPIQVISGDASTRYNISKPAADWGVGNYPNGAIGYINSLVVWGNANNPHEMYLSSVTDQEDFQTSPAFQLVSVYPGDGDRITTCAIFKSRLIITKYPSGVYYADNSSGTILVAKLGDSFGAPTTKCAVQVIDDMLIANTVGSVTSLKAVFSLGNIEQGDYIKMLKAIRMLRENLSPDGLQVRQAIYYEDKKQVMFIYRSRSGQNNDRILLIDFQSGNPKPILITKDQPNCIAMKRDFRRVPRPIYGDKNGNIFEMDSPNRNVGGGVYQAVFRTQYIDFGFVFGGMQQKISETTKIFDFLEITFVPTGRFAVYADIFTDGQYRETVTFYVNRSTYMSRAFSHFKLGRSNLHGKGTISIRKQLHTSGRRISVRCYTVDPGVNFMIQQLTFYFRLAGNAQRR